MVQTPCWHRHYKIQQSFLVKKLKELNIITHSAKTSLETLIPFISASHGSGNGVPVTDEACNQLCSLQEDTKQVLSLARASKGGIATQQATNEAVQLWESSKSEAGHCWADVGRLAELLG
eukprot:gnl/Chilomastix_caulleri/2805.p1 GENE.gnl/Chilomastix_caulleri/2805~~gnl/Chilomastix_caulleri/2805.p1  ORF type:complete len:120 (+),score=15.60 gnl/Chilomastix_caulleri/2805:168-527(+)